MKIQNSNFCMLLWIPDFLERFSEEFFGGRSLVTNFGLTLLSCQALESRTAGEELGGFVRKPENWAKTFPHKTGSKRNIRLHKKLPLSKVFLSKCKCFGNFYSLSAFASAGIQLIQSRGWSFKTLFCKFKSTSSFYIQLQEQTGAEALNNFTKFESTHCLLTSAMWAAWMNFWVETVTKTKPWLMITEHWLTARMTIDKRTIGQWPTLMYTWKKTKLLQMVAVSDTFFINWCQPQAE